MSTTIEHLQALRHSLQSARDTKHVTALGKPSEFQQGHERYIAGLTDGLDVALRLIALEIQMAEDGAVAAPHQ
jgi:hypothetical protein